MIVFSLGVLAGVALGGCDCARKVWSDIVWVYEWSAYIVDVGRGK